MATIDMTGQKYGKLTAIKRVPKPEHIKSRVAFWLFKCDCGKEVVLNGSNVRSGNTTSCGCMQKEIASKTHSVDLVGMRFGKLIALERLPIYNQKTHYLCQCDCGLQVKVDGVNLKRGLTKSCGCNKNASYGVQEIVRLLEQNDIQYKREQTIHINEQTYFVDFVIFINNNFYYLEYDGEQHFRSGSELGWNTAAHLKIVQERDSKKNKYCFSNHIPLIRIPFDHKQITIEDIILSSSSWILTPENEERYYKTRQRKKADAEE